MTATNDFDRRLSDWLAADGDPQVPTSLVPTVVALARETSQRRSPLDRAITRLTWPAVGLPGYRSSTSTIRAIGLLALLAVLLAGLALVMGSLRAILPPPAVVGVLESTGELAFAATFPHTLRLDDGSLLISDGLRLQRYDPRTGQFTELPRTPVGVSALAETASGDLLTVIVVGVPTDEPEGFSEVVVHRLPTGGRQGRPIEVARFDSFHLHSAVALADGRFVILGQEFGDEVLVALLFDSATGMFTRHGTSSDIAIGRPATLLPDGRLLIIDQGPCALAMNVVLYDPGPGIFSIVGSLPCAGFFSTTVLADGRVLVAGGGSSNREGVVAQLSDDAVVIDPVAGTTTWVGPLPAPRWMHASAVAADGRVLLAGGNVGRAGNPSASTVLFDPRTATFGAGPDLLDPRMNATAVALADGRILIFGHTTFRPGVITEDPDLEAEIFR